jgi:hypothetical protein
MSNSGKTGALASKYYRAAMQAALTALKHGDKVNAERLALRAASMIPDSEAPWLVLAALVGPQESLGYARKALQINPESIRARQAVEWALGRLSTQPSSSEPEHIRPIVGMIESMPEIAPPPVREPAQFPEPFQPPDKKVEKTHEAAQPFEEEPEPVQPPEPFLPGKAREDLPRVVQPPESGLFPELYQPPSSTVEDLAEAAQPVEEIEGIEGSEPVQLPEVPAPAIPAEELPRVVPPPGPDEFPELYQPAVVEELPEVSQPGEGIEEPGTLPPESTLEPPPETAIPAKPEPEQLPPPVTRAEVPGEVQPTAEPPQAPSGRRSPLDSLPAWIDVPPVHRPPSPEPPPSPARPAETAAETPSRAALESPKAEKPAEIKPEVEPPKTPGSAAMPVKTKPFTIEPDVAPEQIDLAAIVAKPAKLPPSPSHPLPPTRGKKGVASFPLRIIGYVVFILVVGIVTAGVLFVLPQANDLWKLLFPNKGCSPTLVLEARTFEVRTLKLEADGTLKVPGNHPERAYWVEGTDTNRVFGLAATAENLTFIKSLKDDSLATVTWANCNTVSFTLSAPLPVVPEISALLDQSTSGITVFLPAGTTTAGFSVWGELAEEKIVTFNTPNPEDIQAEVSLLEVKPEPGGKAIRISLSILNTGHSAFTLASGDLALVGEDGKSLALTNSGPALPKEIQPGKTETFDLVFPRPASDTATLKIIGIEYLIEGY